MTTGQSHLITFRAADNIIRMFERSSVTGYTSIASVGMAHGLSDPPPSLGFAQKSTKDGESALVTLSYSSNWSIQPRNIETLANNGSSVTLHFDTQTWCKGRMGKKRSIFHTITRTTTQWGVGVKDDGTITPVYAPVDYVEATNNCIAIHPDEDCLFIGAAAGKSRVHPYSGDVSVGGMLVPGYSIGAQIAAISYAVIDADFSNSGDYLFAIGDDMQLHCFTWNGTALVEQLALPLPAGTSVVKLAWRPDDRYVAVSTYDGTTYRTYIYRRIGYTARLFQTITAMGQLLDWSADGTRIVDGAARKAYKFDNASNTFVDASGEVINLPTNVTSEAINSMMEDLVAVAFGYDEGVRRVAEGDFNAATLKLMLLSASATFDATEDDITNLEAFQVSGQGWPVGGKLLTGVSIADNAQGYAALVADQIKQILINSLQFRYAVVYDDTSNVPIMFIDFRDVITTEAEKTAVFDVSAYGALTFVP
ncbi:WD40/YVTN repeat-like domain-containing protein [Rhizobium phage RHEph12]|nr:WD40/YVTN repeat-like domain-containing protein [Rhizobium phage RHEph12]